MSDIETNTEERLIELLRLVYKLGIIHAKQDQNILNKKAFDMIFPIWDTINIEVKKNE